MKKTAIILSLILCSVACREMPEAYDVWPDWGEEMPDPMVINGAESDETPYEGQPAWNLDLVDGQQLSFSGFRGVARMLQPDWFDSVAKDGDSYVAAFHGDDGKYRMVYDQKNGLFFLEQPGTEFPDGVWLIGAGWGHGNSASATVSKGWALGGANDVGYPKKIGESRWQYTLFLDNGFSFKFFRKRAWNNEITSNDVKCLCPFTITGKANGDFVPGPFFEKGVYTILLDTEEKTLGIADYSFEVAYKINGEPLGVLPDGASMLGISLDLNTGDEIEFTSNFGDISKILQPDMMEAVSTAKARFKGPSGKWNLFYDVNSKLIYMENRSLAYPASIWIQGAGFGHPAAGRTSVKGWVWDSPADCFQMLPVEDGVYETTVFLNGNADFKFYKKRGWGEADEITSMECDPLPADKLEKGWNNHFTGDFVASDSFEAGVYKIRVDVNQNVVALMDFMQESDVKPAEPAVNGVKLAWRTVGDKEYLAADLSLAKGQKMDFKGFNTLQRLLQPDFYKFNDGTSYSSPRTATIRSTISPILSCSIPSITWMRGIPRRSGSEETADSLLLGPMQVRVESSFLRGIHGSTRPDRSIEYAASKPVRTSMKRRCISLPVHRISGSSGSTSGVRPIHGSASAPTRLKTTMTSLPKTVSHSTIKELTSRLRAITSFRKEKRTAKPVYIMWWLTLRIRQ